MICRNCGKILEEGELFCPDCGTKAEESASLRENAEAVRYSSVSYTPEPQSDPYSAGTPYSSTESAAAASEPAKQKEFFGRGAFVFCLIVIALLSGTAGAFAYLYFSLLGTL